MGFVTRFLNGASQEIKPKSNESTNSGDELKARKLKPPEGFGQSLLKLPISSNRPEASYQIKVKLNESRQLKFYQVKQLKENSTENPAEKNF